MSTYWQPINDNVPIHKLANSTSTIVGYLSNTVVIKELTRTTDSSDNLWINHAQGWTPATLKGVSIMNTVTATNSIIAAFDAGNTVYITETVTSTVDTGGTTGSHWKVTVSAGLNMRSSYSTSSSILTTLAKGTVVEEIGRKVNGNQLWIKYTYKGYTGYSIANDSSTSTVYMTRTTESVTSSTTSSSIVTTTTASVSSTYDDAEDAESDWVTYTDSDSDSGIISSSGYMVELSELLDFSTQTTGATSSYDSKLYGIRNAIAIQGLPYQFMAIADPRIGSWDEEDKDTDTFCLGQEYAERIMSRIPLVLMTPGYPDFMSSYSDEDKASVISTLAGIIGGTSSDLEDLVTRTGRYYTFRHSISDYYTFVNPMCRSMARYLELQDYTLDNVKLVNVDWNEYTQAKLKTYADIGTMGAVGFYVNSDSSISESFSNDTTTSSLESKINSISDSARELKFLLGYGSSAINVDALDSILQDTDVSSSVENINSMVSSLLGKNNFLTNISTHLATVVNGGRLQFPKIWSDSSFGRSYTLNFKFVSPDCDKLSIYMNVLVPLVHLLGFVEPQSITSNPNGYSSPFLVRCSYKGMFNIDMGIITDMSVTRGAEGMWTPDGIPTCIDVSITIKDLYENLSITPLSITNQDYDTLDNTALMDYIANLCGINVYSPEIKRAIELWLIAHLNSVTDYFDVNLWGGIRDNIQTMIMNVYRPS